MGASRHARRPGRDAAMELDEVLEALRDGRIGTGRARTLIALNSIEQVGGFARVDASRMERTGTPEVVLGSTKTLAEAEAIATRLLRTSGVALISRVRPRDRGRLAERLRRRGATVTLARRSTAVLARRRGRRQARGRVGIMAAGTSDIGTAEEARLMCEAMGCECVTAYDVGIAALGRVFPAVEEMAGAGAIVVVAGMEGALATVVSSLVDVPVIGVPTSVGYGHGGRGAAALASMLQSCAPGLAVVNIDNGIGGGAAAARIARRAR
ncbi:MAG: nickel pincer cofactor biosynthesis protein LarB [Thaumarchaeota archaeon]|nr:nickel pincer cofactor biosynthesis protein LarB [Nitrososphaerota archaeon]